MDTYVAIKDCYYNGMYLKKGHEVQFAVGTVVLFGLLKKIEPDQPAEASKAGKPKQKDVE